MNDLTVQPAWRISDEDGRVFELQHVYRSGQLIPDESFWEITDPAPNAAEPGPFQPQRRLSFRRYRAALGGAALPFLEFARASSWRSVEEWLARADDVGAAVTMP